MNPRPRLIALVLGLVALAAGLAACGGGDDLDPAPRLSECGSTHMAVRITAVRQVAPQTIRFVYPQLPAGEMPCGFAADRYRGVLYLELRGRESVDRPYRELDCVDAELEKVDPDLPLERIAGTKPIDPDQSRALFAAGVSCPVVSRMQQSFVID